MYSEILEVLLKTAASAKGKKAVTASNKLQEENQWEVQAFFIAVK